MGLYSKEAQAWFDAMRASIQDRIDSFNELPSSAKEKYADIHEYFDWPIDDQKMWGYPGAIECDVDDSWDELKPKTRKELGGKVGAAKLMAEILRDEFDIDIVEAVLRNSQPCYAVQDQINDYDWEEDEENSYKKLTKFINDKNLDRGSALELYWGFRPDFYTQFENDKEINDKSTRRAFMLLKKLESRLLDDEFKTNTIPFEPVTDDIRISEGAKWQIPEALMVSNILANENPE